MGALPDHILGADTRGHGMTGGVQGWRVTCHTWVQAVRWVEGGGQGWGRGRREPALWVVEGVTATPLLHFCWKGGGHPSCTHSFYGLLKSSHQGIRAMGQASCAHGPLMELDLGQPPPT